MDSNQKAHDISVVTYVVCVQIQRKLLVITSYKTRKCIEILERSFLLAVRKKSYLNGLISDIQDEYLDEFFR